MDFGDGFVWKLWMEFYCCWMWSEVGGGSKDCFHGCCSPADPLGVGLGSEIVPDEDRSG